MKEFLYNIIYGIFYLVSKLPYRALYVISDIANLVLYHIVRYRRDIVRRNITSAFPEKSLEECISIERGFYKWFCDYFVETVKLMSVSRQELLSRIEFRGIDKIEECFDRGQTCAGILGHYGNWELLSATGLVIKKHPEAVIGLIYHPAQPALRPPVHQHAPEHGRSVRPQEGHTEISRVVPQPEPHESLRLHSRPGARYRNIHLWLPFLNHDTPVFTGAERIMRKMNNAVFYIDVERPERGKYIYTFKLMTDKPGEMPEFEITKSSLSAFEQTIRREPRFYLWSHNRWKRTREKFDKEFKIENGHVVRK